MDRFLVRTNESKDEGFEITNLIKNYLEKNGKTVELEIMDDKKIYGKEEAYAFDTKNRPDIVIVLGGDGTFIQVASPISQLGLPIMGINMGNLGYLAEVDKDEVEPSLDKLIADDFHVEERMMLKGAVTVDGKLVNTHEALNEIVISRVGAIRVIRYEIYVNDKLLVSYDADGIIVSTPTGSTGYNMSAGGPIVEPDSRVLLVTPISAHTLNSRSIVLSPDDRLKVAIAPSRNNSPQEAQVCFDGGVWYSVDPGDSVEIVRSEQITRVIKMSKESFLDTLARKISS